MDSALLWMFLTILGGLTLLKAIYVFTMALALPQSGGALFTSTHRSKIETILNTLPMKADQIVVDLGCGDGRFLSAASRLYGVKGIGYEINLLAYLLARIRQAFLQKRVRIERRNFWKASIRDADFVFCYLFPDVMANLANKAKKEMKNGAILISCNFPLPGWSPEKVFRAAHSHQRDPIYIYRKGA